MEEIKVGTPEWDQLTLRRAELIFKKNRAGLDPEEQFEFDKLQETSLRIINTTFPVGLPQAIMSENEAMEE